jgi:hypothetical protein
MIEFAEPRQWGGQNNNETAVRVPSGNAKCYPRAPLRLFVARPQKVVGLTLAKPNRRITWFATVMWMPRGSITGTTTDLGDAGCTRTSIVVVGILGDQLRSPTISEHSQ